MNTFLLFLWSIAKAIIAFFLFWVACDIAMAGGEGVWVSIIILVVALAFHWRFWIVAIPAFCIGMIIHKRL